MNVHLQKVSVHHIEFLWYLRNRSDIYCYFRTPKPISWEEHVQWMMPRILGLTDSLVLVIEVDQIPVGQIRCDYGDDGNAEVSISLLKEFRGKGIAKDALRQAIKEYRRIGRVNRLLAEIRKENIPSQKLFEGQNFTLEREDEVYCHYCLPLR